MDSMNAQSHNPPAAEHQVEFAPIPPMEPIPVTAWISAICAAVCLVATIIVFAFTNFETKEHSGERIAIISAQISELKQQIDKNDDKRDDQFKALAIKIDSLRGHK